MNFDLKYDDDFFSSNNELDYNCLPPEFHTSLNDFYVTKKTKINAQFNECKKLLDQKEKNIVIHGLGNAINQAILLAIKLENAMKNSIRLDIVTSKIFVNDKILKMLEYDEIKFSQRVVSVIHIHISKIIY